MNLSKINQESISDYLIDIYSFVRAEYHIDIRGDITNNHISLSTYSYDKPVYTLTNDSCSSIKDAKSFIDNASMQLIDRMKGRHHDTLWHR